MSDKFRIILLLIIIFSQSNCLSPDKSHIDKRVCLVRIEQYYNTDLETGVLDTVVQYTCITKYDYLGNQIEEIHKDRNGKNKSISSKDYLFYTNGRLKQITTKVRGKLFFKEIFLYDSNGNKIEKDETIITKKGMKDEREFSSIKYNYINGKLTEELELPGNNLIQYFYNDRGYLNKTLTYWRGKLYWINEYESDSLGNKISIKLIDAEKKKYYIWLFKYDSLNRKIETLQLDEKGNRHTKWVYKYDGSNRIIEEVEFGLNDRPAGLSKISYIVKKPNKNFIMKDPRLFVPEF
ncbi:MAG TPA: hypothetical protein VMT35_09085 [Ignavibacteriaceae bacterium]|nr:hypothetical protein [Ignavibacteriaceae bacterium]